ncbi:RNA polymerase sigma factor RpoH [Oryzomonas sagensis]|uniref:RNA polymerase sigma factor n=1 Tax=Oryzomonas sagensis TaxID=2603857 RepID=A0ABQ6TLP2_9BACT|nr:RNA polymerase sigma factor RpoH [Oryzomonas sagensis]KAB0669332.1 RNA polymerase sigma factor RpoH [Oryzomonas sagensis]
MVTRLPVVADSLTLYLSEIRKVPLLSEDEEHRFAVKFFEEKDLEAAHSLITANLRFVVKVAAEYRHYGMKMLDLIQEGNIGLMMAVRKFNPYKGIRLISYAVWWIRAYIQNHIVSAWSLLKIGTTQAQRKLFFKLREAKDAIRRLGNGEDDLHATALSLNVSDQEVAEMEQRLHGEASLDAEIPGGEGFTLLENLADDRQNQEEALSEFQESQQLHRQVARVVAGLNEKERFIVEKRISADEPLTLQEIATHFSISRERVRQIEEAALKKMKTALTPLLSAA